jgi:hypothetical protein
MKEFFKNIYKGGISTVGLMAIFIFTSCVPSVSEEGSDPACSGGTFNSKTRACVSSSTGGSTDGAPAPITGSFALTEDTADSFNLRYTDNGGDLATSCEAYSLSSGLVKRLEHDGVIINSNTDIDDAHNIYVRFVSAGSASVSRVYSAPNTYITINVVLGSTTSSTIASLINGDADDDCSDGDASCDLNASISQFIGIDNTLSYTPISKLPCNCTGGTCSLSLTPTDNYNGSTDLYYRLTDNDGTSAYKLSSVSIASVNDAPSITVTTGSMTVTEDVVAGGTLATDAGFSVSDTNDGDPTGATLTYEVGTDPAGSLTLNGDGTYSYVTATNSTAADSFTFRVCDPDLLCTAYETINISVTAAADAPYGTLTSITGFNEDTQANDPTDDQVTLTYVEPDGGETISSCSVSSLNGVYVSTDCTCVANVCTVGLTGKAHTTGVGSFDYTVTSGTAPTTSSAQTVNFIMYAQGDNPIPFGTASSATSFEDNVGTSAVDSNGSVTFNESSTHLPNYVDFEIATAHDPDGDTSLTYSIVTAPSSGTLTGCMDATGSSGTTDLTCTYTPSNGNLNNSATLADTTANKGFDDVGATDLRFISSTYGDSSNAISVEIIEADGVGGGSEEAWLDGNTIKILYESGVSDTDDIIAAVDANARVKALIRAEDSDGAPATTLTGINGTYTLSAGTATADSFVYRVTDSTGATADREFHISIQPVDDTPLICEYSNYSDTTVCGLNGCIGNGDPPSITPDLDGLVYYDTNSAACYQSSGGSWSAITSYIKDKTVNELQTIVIDKIKVDEGGGDAGEDAQSLSITVASSSNTTLVPLGNIKVVFSGTTTCDTLSDNCNAGTLPIAFGDGSSEDAGDFSLQIVPVVGQTGSSDIELTFSDGTQTTEVEFTVTVQGNSATHGGWEAMAATGPKVDRNGFITEDRNHCPFSRDLCEGGTSCYSTSATPLNNAAADPDSFEAIYLYEVGSTQTCFRVKRTAVQDIHYVPKTTSYVSIVYTDGVTAGSETVATTGSGTSGDPYVITVTIEDNVSTTDQIITAIEGDTTANGLVKVFNRDSGEEQDSQSVVSVGNLSNANWETFTTNCAISHTDEESACSTYGETCLGKGAPGVTPTVVDSRYYDEEGGVCYRAMKDSSDAFSWVPYDATSEIKLTWNAFSVSGSGSITEYKVFRRASEESYDYDDPINRLTIDGSSSTYTFMDNAFYSLRPPIPNTVYFYEVRPVVDGVLTATSDVFTELRMVSPPKNMAFVHRWMANKTICDIMNRATDPNNNYRCEYIGPGDVTDSGTQYYDISFDYLVDRYEAGCAYSAAPACTGTVDGSCIGIDDPTTEGATAADDSVYYARSNGTCYVRVAGAWQQITGNTQVDNYLAAVDNAALVAFDANDLSTAQDDETTDKYYNRSNLPPLVNVTQADAHRFCSSLDQIDFEEIYGIGNNLSYKLPSRKEQIAFSQWDTSADATDTDSEILALEAGLSLNSISKCNSSNASGISSSYSDVSVPSSADFFSLPGTFTSNIRSVVTGSRETSNCVSLFGVQDAVGNVAEWTLDRITCHVDNGGVTEDEALSKCFAADSTDGNNLTGALDGDYTSSSAAESAVFGNWALDGVKGPCNDASGGDDICDSNIGSWSLETEAFSAGRMFVPVGLVAHRDFLADNPTSNVDMLELGTVIDHDLLHDDTIKVNSKYIAASNSTRCGGLAYGGSYDGSGTGAGVWTSEYIPCGNDAEGVLTIQDVSYVYISGAGTPSLVNIKYTASTGAISVGVSGNDITVNLGDSVTPTAEVVAAAVNTAATGLVEAYISGDSSATQTPFSSEKYLEDVIDEAKNNRTDVGFRCIIPIDEASSDYDEN